MLFPTLLTISSLLAGDDPDDDICNPTQFELRGGWVLLLLGVVYLCAVLDHLCDEFLVPSLEELCEELDIPEHVAGVSLLAFGGSAPELAIHLFATFEKREIGLSTVLGSGLWNTSLAFAVVCLLVPAGAVLHVRPLIRDVSVYLSIVGLLIYFRIGGEIDWYQAVVLIVLYFVYIWFLFASARYFSKRDKDHKRTKSSNEERAGLLDAESGHASGDEDDDAPASLGSRMCAVSLIPFATAFSSTIPDVKRRYTAGFIASLTWVLFVSWALMQTVQRAGCVLEIDEAYLGSVILAIGASLPDTIAVAVAARKGHGSMATNALIGSNIFDMLIGLGGPWLSYRLMWNETTKLSNPHVLRAFVFLFVSVLVMVIAIVLSKFRLYKSTAILPALLYVSYVAYETTVAAAGSAEA